MCETPLSPTVRAGFPSGELISCVQSESEPSSRNGAKDDKQDCGGRWWNTFNTLYYHFDGK